MTTYNHTALPASGKTAATGALFNAVFASLDAAIGDLTALTTSNKSDVVTAINEVKNLINFVGAADSGVTATTVNQPGGLSSGATAIVVDDTSGFVATGYIVYLGTGGAGPEYRVIDSVDVGTKTLNLTVATGIDIDDGALVAIAAIDLSDYVGRGGADTLTSDWDIGDGRYIAADKIRARDAAGLLLQDDGGNGIFVQDGGYVGIGTTSPARLLHLAAASPEFLYETTGSTANNKKWRFITSSGDGNFSIQTMNDAASTAGVGIQMFRTGNTVDRTYINSSVGIGISTPDSNLHVHKATAGTIAADASTAIALENSGNCSLEFLTPNEISAQIAFSRPGSLLDGYIKYTHATLGGDIKFAIGAAGARYEMNLSHLKPSVDDTLDLGGISYRWDDIYATNGTIQTSDIRKKDLVENGDLGLDFILALAPKKWVWKDREEPATEVDGVERPAFTKRHRRPHYGLSAQQVKEAMDSLGIDDFAGYVHNADADAYALRYSEFIGPIIQSIQELSARISALE